MLGIEIDNEKRKLFFDLRIDQGGEMIIYHGYKIPIGGVEYTILCDPETVANMHNDGDNGQCNKQRLTIAFSPMMPRWKQTLIHEIVHAINFEYCCGQLTEEQVDGMSHGTLQVLEHFSISMEVR